MAKHEHMRQRIRRPALMTAEELAALPKFPCYELYAGLMRVKEPSGSLSSNIGAELIIRLGNHIHTHKLGKILGESGGYVLRRNPDTILAPDISFIQRSRVPYGSAWEKFFEGGPDLAIEVQSPSDRFIDRQRKTDLYLAGGVRLVWIIRPHQKTAVVRRPDGSTEVIPTTGTLDGEDVLPGFRCGLAELFAED